MTWVALHEVTHAVQFAGVPWLHAHVAGAGPRAAEERRGAPRRAAQAAASRARDEVKRVMGHLRSGDLISIVTTTPERETLDRVQAVMAVIEGHAEHVMDAVAPDLLPSLPQAPRRARSPAPLAVGPLAAGGAAARPRAQAPPVRAGQVLLRRDRARAGPGRAPPSVVESQRRCRRSRSCAIRRVAGARRCRGSSGTDRSVSGRCGLAAAQLRSAIHDLFIRAAVTRRYAVGLQTHVRYIPRDLSGVAKDYVHKQPGHAEAHAQLTRRSTTTTQAGQRRRRHARSSARTTRTAASTRRTSARRRRPRRSPRRRVAQAQVHRRARGPRARRREPAGPRQPGLDRQGPGDQVPHPRRTSSASSSATSVAARPPATGSSARSAGRGPVSSASCASGAASSSGPCVRIDAGSIVR